MPDFRALFDNDKLGHWDLVDDKGNPCDKTLTIERVESEKVRNEKKEEKAKAILYFRGVKRPMICNVTNCKTIAGLYGRKTEGWIGKRVTLYPTTVDAFGETKECIRIKNRVPNGDARKPPPTPRDETPPPAATGEEPSHV